MDSGLVNKIKSKGIFFSSSMLGFFYSRGEVKPNRKYINRTNQTNLFTVTHILFKGKLSFLSCNMVGGKKM